MRNLLDRRRGGLHAGSRKAWAWRWEMRYRGTAFPDARREMSLTCALEKVSQALPVNSMGLSA